MRTRRLPALATTVLVAGAILGAAPATATTPIGAGRSTTVPDCAGLARVRIPASVMSLPTTGGRVTSTSVMTRVISGETITYCQVNADIFPVDPSAPPIMMRVALPHDWNRRAMMFGGGGYNGTIPDLASNVPFGPTDRPVPLARRYATFAARPDTRASRSCPGRT